MFRSATLTTAAVSRLHLGEHRDAVADAEKALGLGEPTSELFYKAARVYALAAVVVAAEVRKKGRETVSMVEQYQDRATVLLRKALERMSDQQRASFWRDGVPVDPAAADDPPPHFCARSLG